jgi:aminoglycoside phosphotransferase family enzyme
VFLTGERAFKLKRAVRYDYLDFSTTDRRRRFVEAELAINRPAAPSLYVRVATVTRDADGTLHLDGPGSPVEWLLEMTRFDGNQLCDRLAERGALPLDAMPALARAVATLHAGAAAPQASAASSTATGLRSTSSATRPFPRPIAPALRRSRMRRSPAKRIASTIGSAAVSSGSATAICISATW